MIKKITLLTLILVSTNLLSQIINTAPYILTVSELKQWTTTGTTASPDLISTVSLAPRFTNTQTQFNPALNNNMQIAYLPDGMNNFGNYYGEQSQFNLFNFTHWAYIDKLVWFGGTSTQTIQIPSSPWANAAHKNGVKIFGNVFFSPTAFGGSTATLQSFLEQDINGSFIAIPKMIAIMQYYNFDGWFINQETATTAATAQLMYSFVKELTLQAEANGKGIMWYDAMTLTGSVGWQNRLNGANSVFVQNNEDGDLTNGYEKRVSSSIFINFFWSSASFPTLSRTKAIAIGRTQYEVFTGADIWPGRNQGAFETNGNTFMTNLHENSITPITSLGLFATNCLYNHSNYSNFNNDPNDVAAFYSSERHMFGGFDRNPATVDATGFKGMANWIPETSVISTIPFNTNFCTGHGLKKFTDGVQTSSNSWHNMNSQDIPPTWEFGFSQNGMLTADWDFSNAYNFGNSLKVTGSLPAGTVDLMLYKTKLTVTAATKVDLTSFQSSVTDGNVMKLILVFADDVTQKYEFPIDITQFSQWTKNATPLTAYIGREIAMIGLRLTSSVSLAGYAVNIGNLSVNNDPPLSTFNVVKSKSMVAVSYPVEINNILFTINWPGAANVKYSVYSTEGKFIKEDNIALSNTTAYTLNTTEMASGTYLVIFHDGANNSEVKKIIIK